MPSRPFCSALIKQRPERPNATDQTSTQNQSAQGSAWCHACIASDAGCSLQLALGIQCVRAAEVNKLSLETTQPSVPVSPTCADAGRGAFSRSLVLASRCRRCGWPPCAESAWWSLNTPESNQLQVSCVRQVQLYRNT